MSLDVTGLIGEDPNAFYLHENYVASSTDGITEDGSSPKRWRMRFNTFLHILMLPAVTITGAHIAQHAEMPVKFEDAWTYFIKSSPNRSAEDAIKPT